MKRLIIVLQMVILSMTACREAPNPLLQAFDTPFGTPPFEQISHEHYVPAFIEAIRSGLLEAEAIANNPAEPGFANTIEALEFSGEQVSLISSIFYNLNSAETDAAMQEIAREVAPMLSDYYNDILFNKALFDRIRAVYEQRASLQLTTEQATLLEKTYRQFAREGASLDAAGQERLRAISRELTELNLRFQENVLAETNAYLLHLTDEAGLAGLPATAIDAAAQLAGSRNLEGWAFSLQAPSFVPFMQYADNRDLRREMFMAFSTRGSGGNENDNREILLRIANLRLEKANLLGYQTHAHYVLEERMAETPEKVNELLNKLLQAARPAGEKEFSEVQQLASGYLDGSPLMPWDWSYFSEKLRKQRFDFDQEVLRPYFKMENVVNGVFDLTQKLWGLEYRRNESVPVYHTDVETYEVYDSDGKFLAVLYLDFYPRDGKSPGAWMTSFREQYKKDGTDVRPHVSLVCNFSKPTDNAPSLLTFNEFSTFLHEFGHALHGMLSDVTYPGLSGTSVYRDFVELPSMLMENWAVERDFLDMFAIHYQTGEKIQQEMVQKIIDARNFNAGYGILRQLGFGFNDMAWHSIMEPVEADVMTFERNAMSPAALLPLADNTMVSPTFSHIFAGGYSAGYYSYKWSEVLDADAFEVFRQNGIFNIETAHLLREHILSKGGSEHPMVLYKRFRGQEPSIDALLRRDGLL